jgi:4-hydroxy-4-methyl-2-oxoglutarate aldolase
LSDHPVAPVAIVLATPTPVLADAMDRLGLDGFALDRTLRPLVPGGRLAGPALCVAGAPRPHRTAPPAGLYTRIDEAVTPGCVVMIATGGYETAAVVGGNAAIGFAHRGAAGIVTDGTARDSDEFIELGFPCFCRGTSVLGFPGRWDYTAIGGPITMRGLDDRPVRVLPGDLVVGDRDGVLVVPAAQADAIAQAVMRIEHRQARIKRLLQAGVDRGTAYRQPL